MSSGPSGARGATWLAWLPGLQLARTYERAWLRSDLVAGVSVAAVDAVRGLVDDSDGVYASEQQADARPIPGLLIYRFSAGLVFFNADHFKDRVRALVAAADMPPQWFLFDAESANLLDVTAAEALDELRVELADQGIVLAVARAEGLFRVMLERTGVAARIGAEHLFPSVRAGAQAFLARTRVGGGDRLNRVAC